MKQLPKDIEVEIEFLRHEHGGREKSAFSGYRPQFFYNGNDWDAVHEYIATETVEPGERVKAYLAFLSPQEHEGKVYPSMPFLVTQVSEFKIAQIQSRRPFTHTPNAG